jgi:hypothetical protein
LWRRRRILAPAVKIFLLLRQQVGPVKCLGWGCSRGNSIYQQQYWQPNPFTFTTPPLLSSCITKLILFLWQWLQMTLWSIFSRPRSWCFSSFPILISSFY